MLQSSGTAESNDLVAYSLAVGDAGREIARFPTSYGIGDGEMIPSPNGLVMSPSTAPGLQPADIDNVAVAWIDRNGNTTTSPTPLVRVDFASITVDVNGRSWTFDDPVDGAAPSLHNFSPTFDGGVIGVVQHSTDRRTGVVRGWSDGSVDTWVLPPEIVRADLEPSPTGHVLVPSPGTFMTAEVFALRDDRGHQLRHRRRRNPSDHRRIPRRLRIRLPPRRPRPRDRPGLPRRTSRTDSSLPARPRTPGLSTCALRLNRCRNGLSEITTADAQTNTNGTDRR